MKLGKILANPAVAIALGAALVRLPEKISKLGIFNRSGKEQQETWAKQRQQIQEQLRAQQIERTKRQVTNPPPEVIANYLEGMRLWNKSDPGSDVRIKARMLIYAAATAGHMEAQRMADANAIPY